MENAIFNIELYEQEHGEIETVYPDREPARDKRKSKRRVINYKEHAKHTKFYNQIRREEEHLVKNILQGVLFCLFPSILAKISGVSELHLGTVIIMIFALVAVFADY